MKPRPDTASLDPLHGHSHLAVVQQHAVHLFDGTVGSVLRLKVHECVAFGSVLITHHLQKENLSAV